MSRINVLGVNIDNLTKAEAVQRALELTRLDGCSYMVTPNPEIVMAAWEDERVQQALDGAALVVADGVGVISAAKILGTPLKEHLPGIDVADAILNELNKREGRVFLFGAKKGVAENATARLKDKYPRLKIVGSSCGYGFDSDKVVEKINEASPDFVFVCLGVPKQELWMAENAPKIKRGLLAGLGGSLDVISGETKRAPLAWQKMNLEWLYRSLEEPKRFKKIKKLPNFVLEAWRERLGKANGKR